MSEETIDSIQKPGWNPKWRKRKKHEGMAIDGQLAEQLDALRPLADSGLFCKAHCRKWTRWRDIEFSYEIRDGRFIRLMWCKCHTLLKEEQLT